MMICRKDYERTAARDVRKTDELCPKCEEGKVVYYLWDG